MGRPPIGKVAMTSTERSRRHRAGAAQPAPKAKPTPRERFDPRLLDEIARLKARIAELEAKRVGGVVRSGRAHAETTFSETGRLRAEIAKLKSDNIKFKAMLAEEPDAAKLRKKVIDQKAEMASLHQENRRLAKERDKHRSDAQRYKLPAHKDARSLLVRKTFNAIVKALHPDRRKLTTDEEMAEAERQFIALKPLFGEE
jgi:hypothetical protein